MNKPNNTNDYTQAVNPAKLYSEIEGIICNIDEPDIELLRSMAWRLIDISKELIASNQRMAGYVYDLVQANAQLMAKEWTPTRN